MPEGKKNKGKGNKGKGKKGSMVDHFKRAQQGKRNMLKLMGFGEQAGTYTDLKKEN
jgi:hypothetical protein